MKSSGSSHWLKYLPNSLTAIRFALAFVFPFCHSNWQLSVIAVAILTEFLDGYTARRFSAVTKFGQAFDPVADKLFIISAILTLFLTDRLTLVQFGLIAMRDLVVSAGSLAAFLISGQRAIHAFKPRKLGKLTTALQFALLLYLFTAPQSSWTLLAIYIVAVASCVSAVDYLEIGYERILQARLESTTT
jgi:CDP-diacylglycerol--glycerol-3-phosphate 3-phosphatidyltransferase